MSTGPGFPSSPVPPPRRAQSPAATAREPLGWRFFCFAVWPASAGRASPAKMSWSRLPAPAVATLAPRQAGAAGPERPRAARPDGGGLPGAALNGEACGLDGAEQGFAPPAPPGAGRDPARLLDALAPGAGPPPPMRRGHLGRGVDRAPLATEAGLVRRQTGRHGPGLRAPKRNRPRKRPAMRAVRFRGRDGPAVRSCAPSQAGRPSGGRAGPPPPGPAKRHSVGHPATPLA